MTTSFIPYTGKHFQIDFDFIADLLIIETNDGSIKNLSLRPCSVDEFYHEIMSAMESLDMPITIWTTSIEVQDRTPFEKDHKHASYDPKYTQRFWQILAQTSQVFTEFWSHFIGKASPLHFFWGSFDLAVTRFSGRPGPPHTGAPNCGRFVMVDAYSHELSSCGLWPGGGPVNGPIFYSYA